MKYIKTLLLILIISLPTLIYSQHNSTYTHDTTLVNTYFDSTKNYLFSGNKKAVYFIKIIDSLSKVNNYNYGLYKSNLFYGIHYYVTDHYRKSIDSYKKSIEYCDKKEIVSFSNLHVNISYAYSKLLMYDSSIHFLDKVTSLKEISNYPALLLKVVFGKANIRIQENNYIEALKYIEEGSEELNKIEPSESFLGYYSTIGNFYRNVEDFDKAIDAYKKSIEYQIQFNKTKNKWKTNFGIAYLYMRIKNDYDSALYYAFKGLNENEYELSPVDSLSLNLQLGNIFFEKNDIDSSSYYYLQVLNNKRFKDFPFFQAATYTNLGLYFNQKNHYKKAKKYLLLGKEISKQFGLLKFQKSALIELALNEEKANNISSAYKYLKDYNKTVDSLKVEEATQQALDLEYRTYLIKRKYKNELLTERVVGQDKKIVYQRVGIFVVIVFLVIIFIILLYVNKSKKKIYLLNDKLNNSIAELKKMSQFKENMTNMIVHDLKNPLSTILNVDAIEEKAESNNMVQQSGYRMLNLVENILSVYKYEDTKMELEKEKVSLNDILDNSIKEVKYLAEKKILTLSIAEELNSCVNLDKDIIRRVFVNILTNAIKFSPIDNQICINAIIDRTTIIISIVNQGIPIPKAYHKVIFEPFKQIKKKSSGKIQSTGLGLAFCKMAIEAHGGEMGVNSDE